MVAFHRQFAAGASPASGALRRTAVGRPGEWCGGRGRGRLRVHRCSPHDSAGCPALTRPDEPECPVSPPMFREVTSPTAIPASRAAPQRRCPPLASRTAGRIDGQRACRLGDRQQDGDDGGQLLVTRVTLDDLDVQAARPCRHSGGLPCLRAGRSACLVRSMASDRIRTSRVSRGVDDVVDQAALGRVVGVHQLGLYSLTLRAVASGSSALGDLPAEDDVGGALGAHHGDLVGRPGVGEVGADGLGVHDDVRAAVRLAQDQRDPRHGRVAVGVEQLRAVPDDARRAPGRRPGRKPGHVQQGDERDVEGVAHLDEARGLLRAPRCPGHRPGRRLVGDDADDLAVEPGQRADDVAGPALVDLQVVAVVDDLLDHLAHVVRRFPLGGDQVEQQLAAAVGRASSELARRALAVVLRQHRQQVAHLGEAGLLVVVGEVATPEVSRGRRRRRGRSG